MKNVLFASTALVAFAGAASAEITITGSAEMGIFNADTFVAPGVVASGVTQFHTDIDVTFTMSGETDGGLTFGATVDLDENGAFAPATQGGETIFISGAFGTLTMGDTDGAIDWATTEVNFNSGSIQDDETIHAGYNGGQGLDGLYDGQIARYDYSFGDFAVAVSAELDDTNAVGNDDVLGLGLRYNVDLGGTTVGLGLGYQSASLGGVSVDTLGVSANASFGGGFTAGITYFTYDNHVPNVQQFIGARTLTPGFDSDHISVGVGYTSGAISANLNYGQISTDAPGPVGSDFSGLGLSVGYDLGGGASVVFGYGTSSGDIAGTDLGDVDTVSLGVSMSF